MQTRGRLPEGFCSLTLGDRFRDSTKVFTHVMNEPSLSSHSEDIADNVPESHPLGGVRTENDLFLRGESGNLISERVYPTSDGSS